MNWDDLLAAIALVLVLEGIIPFVNPGGLRRTMAALSQMGDETLRTVGMLSMALGLIILYFVRF